MDPTVQVALISTTGIIAVAAFSAVVSLLNRNNETAKANTVAAKAASVAVAENTKITKAGIEVTKDNNVQVREVHHLVDGHLTDMRTSMGLMQDTVLESALKLKDAISEIQALKVKIESLGGQKAPAPK